MLSQRVGGMRGALTQALIGNAYSDEPKYLATFVIVEQEKGKTLVTLDLAMVVRMVLGNVNRVDLNKNKNAGVDADKALQALKARAESEEQTAAQSAREVARLAQTTAQPPRLTLSAEGYNAAGMGLFNQQKSGEAEAAFREANQARHV